MPFTTFRPLRFGDCDPSGIAYFPSYLNILVGVMEEFFATAGVNWVGMLTERRITTPTVRLEVTFHNPGFFGDRLDFAVHVRRLGRSSLTFDHRVSVDGRPVWSARQVIVAASMDTRKSVPWPDDARAALLRHVEPD